MVALFRTYGGLLLIGVLSLILVMGCFHFGVIKTLIAFGLGLVVVLAGYYWRDQRQLHS